MDAFINALLQKLVWQMTGQELVDLIIFALSLAGGQGTPASGATRAVGVQALADELACCQSSIYALMRAAREDGSSAGGGVLKDAIISRIGRNIVFDVERARALASAYKTHADEKKK